MQYGRYDDYLEFAGSLSEIFPKLLTEQYMSSARERLLKHYINSDTYEIWTLDGRAHRDGDLPAIIRDTCTEWRRYGERHRDGDLPAKITVVKYRTDKWWKNEWWKNGYRHRDGDLPAVETPFMNGKIYREWWKNGRKVRDNRRQL